MAARADRHLLYEAAVQDPESEVAFVQRTYKRLRKKKAMRLREDFCGTACFSVQWAKTDREREAWGLDLDGPTLEWGREHHVEPAGEAVASRVHLQCENVLSGKTPKVGRLLRVQLQLLDLPRARAGRSLLQGGSQGPAQRWALFPGRDGRH